MADVFISYARVDQASAARVAKRLQAAGFNVWWDADLPAHRAYSEVIERNLADARAVVVLWSNNAAKSQWVRAEADFARSAGKLVQAQVDGSIPPMPFNQIQCADLKGWRGNASHPGWSKLQASVQALVSGEEQPAPSAARPHLLQDRRWWVAAALALIIAASLIFMFVGHSGEQPKPVLAVLPFRSLDAHDENLVAGIWEDTRQAIGRNPQLVVLGPNTVEQLASKGEEATAKAADYLLEASVRTAGDHIRVSADLVRTKDGAQLWTQSFDRKLDDVFALQSEIAGEIEGRIRGRLAKKGGVRPEHIATSGDAYALYADARAKLRARDTDAYPMAYDQLQQVLKLDPNFAPAWAALAQIVDALPLSRMNWKIMNSAESNARRAIELAPNLAAGHAALAFALHLKGPVARAEIDRAVELDPNDYEALLWLGNMRSEAGDKKGSLDAFTRALAIEPLFWPAVLNKYSALKDAGDEAGMADLIAQEQRLGGDYFATAIQIDRARSKGNLAEAANLGLQYWATGKKEGRTVIGLSLWPVLLQLGFLEEANRASPAPDFAPYLWRNDPKGLDIMEAHHIDTKTFFAISPLTENASRVYVLSGRGATLASLYLSLKATPQEFRKLSVDDTHFLHVAPLVAVALKGSGHEIEATELLSAAEELRGELLQENSPKALVLLARIYAAQGRKVEALAQLTSAVNRGFVPEPPELLTDLALDPAFASLKGDPRFDWLRRQILGTVARERALVHTNLLRQAVG